MPGTYRVQKAAQSEKEQPLPRTEPSKAQASIHGFNPTVADAVWLAPHYRLVDSNDRRTNFEVSLLLEPADTLQC